jgi:hypothetical protein
LIGTVVYQRRDMASSERRLEQALEYQATLALAARQELEESTSQMRASMFAISEQAFVSLERSISETPTVLKFYGIGEDDLENVGLTPAEFSFLLANFTAGGIHIKATAIRSPEAVDDGPFASTSWYYSLLARRSVQEAWPLLSQAISESVYKRKIESTLRDLGAI